MSNALANVVENTGAVTLPDNKTHTYRMEIRSESSNNLYIVAQAKKSGEWQCSCPGWIFKKPGKPRGCKHLTAMLPMLLQVSDRHEQVQAAPAVVQEQAPTKQDPFKPARKSKVSPIKKAAPQETQVLSIFVNAGSEEEAKEILSSMTKEEIIKQLIRTSSRLAG